MVQLCFIRVSLVLYLVVLKLVAANMPWPQVLLETNIGRRCVQGDTCFHGKCSTSFDSKELETCLCRKGWKGLSCNIPVETGGESPKKIKSAHLNLLTRLTETLTNGDNKNTFKSAKIIKKDLTKSEQMGERLNVNNVCDKRYVRRPLSQRRCTMGVLCTYGVCDEVDRTSDRIIFQCDCDKGAIGMLCGQKCCKNCGNYGNCFLDNNGTEMCDCHPKFIGEFCHLSKTELPQQVVTEVDSDSSIVPTVLLVVALFLTVTSLLVIVPVVLWRRRSIVIFKLLRYFRKDEDSYTHDVLLCYNNNPDVEMFVKTILQSRLENMALHICTYVVHNGSRTDGEEELFHSYSKDSGRILLISSQGLEKNLTDCELTILKFSKSMIVNIKRTTASPGTANCNDTILDDGIKKLGVSLTYPDPNNEKANKEFWRLLETLLPKKKQMKSTPV